MSIIEQRCKMEGMFKRIIEDSQTNNLEIPKLSRVTATEGPLERAQNISLEPNPDEKILGYPSNLPRPTKEERLNKHFLNFNGLWLDADYDNSFLNKRCLCSHISRMHLVHHETSFFEICLAEGCFCDGFVEQGYTVIVPQKDGKIPKKAEEWVRVPKEILPLVKTAQHDEEISEIIL